MPKTKTQRTDRIELRLRDIAQGTMGHCAFDEYDEGEPMSELIEQMGTESWFQYVAAVRLLFVDVVGHCFELFNLHHYAESFASGAVFLEENSPEETDADQDVRS